MQTYLIRFQIDGMRSEERIAATDSVNARKILKSRYPNCRLVIFNVIRE